jgi:hypothetical protein
MDPLFLIIPSEAAYKQLIVDAVNCGRWRRNPYCPNPDSNGMGVSDSFEPLSSSDMVGFLGAYTTEQHPDTPLPCENDEDWEVYEIQPPGPLKTVDLKLSDEDVDQPIAEDYPLLVMWDWTDDYDRMGSIKTRYFFWKSLVKITVSGEQESEIGRLHRIWHENHGEKFRELVELYNQREAAKGNQS